MEHGLPRASKSQARMNPETFWWWWCQAHKRRLPVVARLFKMLNFVLFKAILPYKADIQRDICHAHWHAKRI